MLNQIFNILVPAFSMGAGTGALQTGLITTQQGKDYYLDQIIYFMLGDVN